MLKTNSKKAMENIQNYIINNFCFDDYDDGTTEEPKTFSEIAKIIYKCFIKEKRYDNDNGRYSEQVIFFDWCSGLPSILDTCYFYNRSAVEDLKNILEETDIEARQYTEQDAEKLLTNLIYREIKKTVK